MCANCNTRTYKYFLMTWNQTDLCKLIGISRPTLAAQLQELERSRKFKPTVKIRRRGFCENDVRQLASIYGFEFQAALDLKKKKGRKT